MKHSCLCVFLSVLIPIGIANLSGQPVLGIGSVSFEQDGYPASASIDGNQNSGWAISPNESSPNYIHYTIEDFAPGIYKIQMYFNFGTYHVMETFTLSWSDDHGTTWHPITEYLEMENYSGAAMSVDETGTITTGVAEMDRYGLTTSLGNITDLRIDTPADASHRGAGSYANENYVLNEFTLTLLSEPVHVNPVHQWNFDEGDGAVASDSVGNADGTLMGATWTEDRFGSPGKAIQTGYNKWVDLPDSVKVEVGTFAAWIYADAHGGYNQPAGPIFSAEQGSGASGFAYRLQLHESGVIAFEAVGPWSTGAARVAISASTLPLNTWTHVAGTYDGYTANVYINGLRDGSSQTYDNYAGMNTSESIRVAIGHLEGWGVQWFQGKIDDARVYDTPLQGAEIQKLVDSWEGHQVNEDGWADTGNWLGWVFVQHAPWIWVEGLNGYLYSAGSGWVFIPMSPRG